MNIQEWLKKHSYFIESDSDKITSLSLSEKAIEFHPDFKKLDINILHLKKVSNWDENFLQHIPSTVQSLTLDKNHIKSFDATQFPQLRYLSLNDVGLESLRLNKSLDFLSIKQNPSFNQDILFKCPLDYLDISDTSIKLLEGDFKHLTHFHMNNCPNLRVNISEMKKLYSFEISKQSLDQFKTPSNLKMITMKECTIKYLDLSQSHQLALFNLKTSTINKIIFPHKHHRLAFYGNVYPPQNYKHIIDKNNKHEIELMERLEIPYILIEDSLISDI